MDKKVFFDRIRPLFGGRFKASQVSGVEVLLDIWQKRYAQYDIRWLAYCLATTFHETARTMQPIEEYGSNARANRLYGVEGSNPNRARRHGNTKRGDGARYKGRGYVQLTWKTNYERAGRILNDDLVGDPELALRPEYAARILYQGCMEGWFTGHKLSDHLTDTKTDYKNARRIINGTDKMKTIAVYAGEFETALRAAFEGEADPWTPPEAPPEPDETVRRPGWGEIFANILKLFTRK